MTSTFVLRGDFCDTPSPNKLRFRKDHYAVVEDGILTGIFDRLPEKYAPLALIEAKKALIIPGMTDLHLHAPQFAFRGTGMDLELMDWLSTYTFPVEKRFSDPAFAAETYRLFTQALTRSWTTRAVIFGTIHAESTLLLMRMLEETGLITLVGKVNMDRESPDDYAETTQESIAQTVLFLEKAQDFSRTGAIITPRFVPTCSPELMKALGELSEKHHLPVQSHLSENPGEIELVRSLHPEDPFYGAVYERFGLFGNPEKTIMAHCVHSTADEIELMSRRRLWVAHCPESNLNISSGISPVRILLDRGIRVGLGSDISGGCSLSIARAALLACQCSNMYWRYLDRTKKPLTITEAFYLATASGGSFFGKVGLFEPGYDFDALLIDDSTIPTTLDLSVRERLSRVMALSDECSVQAKYVRGYPVSLR